MADEWEIPQAARMVVIGDAAALERLRLWLEPSTASTIALCPAAELLVPYDMETRDGESRRRDMERLYAGLRGRLLVRLAVVNLNPEALATEREPPLARIQADWAEIRRRLVSLLNDRAQEGMTFVTLLITEEGEWGETHAADLRALAGEDLAGPASRACRHRCYLLTRLLELGHGRVCHAREAWPILAARLLGFLDWASTEGNRPQMLGEAGLFAWRSVRLVAGVDAGLLAERTRAISREVTRRLLQPEAAPLFGPLPTTLEGELTDSFQAPEHVRAGVEGIATTEWLGIDDGQLDRTIIAPWRWREATLTFAGTVRRHLADQASQNSEAEIASVRQRLAAADDRPGAIFPGPMPRDRTPDDTDPGIETIRRAEADALAVQNQLRAWWHEHTNAARAFVTATERTIIGLVVAIAYFYAVMAAGLLIEQELPGSPLGWIDGLWAGLWGMAGMAAMLVIGHSLQRWRGETAKDQALAGLARKYVNAEARVREQTVAALSRAGGHAKLRRRAAARRTLYRRLARVEEVLQNELQVPDAPREARPSTADHRVEELDAAQSIMKCEIDYPGSPSFDDEEIIGRALDRFRAGWRAMLARDHRRVGFLPATDLLRLCSQQVEQLHRDVQTALQLALITEMASNPSVALRLIREAIADLRLETGTPLYSVDLMEAASPQHRAWVRPEFADAFSFVEGQRGVRRVPEPTLLGDGVIACWHGEVRLDCSGRNSDGTIRFVASRRGTGPAS